MVPHKTDLVNLTPQTMLNKVRPEPDEWPIAVLGYACYTNAYASVAQLDRASVFGTEGWGFESLRVYFSLFAGKPLSPCPSMQLLQWSPSQCRTYLNSYFYF